MSLIGIFLLIFTIAPGLIFIPVAFVELTGRKPIDVRKWGFVYVLVLMTVTIAWIASKAH